ncbi:MAG: phosphoenolpyruvate carboxykinase (ATP) [Caldilineaceae bacterium]
MTEPQATFSACFGAPFMPVAPSRYAELLGVKIRPRRASAGQHGVDGRPHGVGYRMPIKYTRAMVNAALDGVLDRGDDHGSRLRLRRAHELSRRARRGAHPGQHLAGQGCVQRPGARKLAKMFVDNFANFAQGTPAEIIAAGPRV